MIPPLLLSWLEIITERQQEANWREFRLDLLSHLLPGPDPDGHQLHLFFLLLLLLNHSSSLRGGAQRYHPLQIQQRSGENHLRELRQSTSFHHFQIINIVLVRYLSLARRIAFAAWERY